MNKLASATHSVYIPYKMWAISFRRGRERPIKIYTDRIIMTSWVNLANDRLSICLSGRPSFCARSRTSVSEIHHQPNLVYNTHLSEPASLDHHNISDFPALIFSVIDLTKKNLKAGGLWYSDLVHIFVMEVLDCSGTKFSWKTARHLVKKIYTHKGAEFPLRIATES